MATSLTTASYEGRRAEVLGIVTGAAAVLIALALWSYDARGGENWIGPAGAFVAGLLVTAVGLGAWVIPVELLLTTIRLFRRKNAVLGIATLAATFVIVLVGCAMAHLLWPDIAVLGGHLPGGVLGELFGEILRSLFGLTGAFIVGLSVLLVTFVLRVPFSLTAVVIGGYGLVRGGSRRMSTSTLSMFRAWRESRMLESEEEFDRDESDELDDPELDDEEPIPAISALDDEADQTIDTREFIDEPSAEATSDGSDAIVSSEESPAPASRRKRNQGPKIIAPTASSIRSSDAKARKPTKSVSKNGKPFVLPPPSLFVEPPPNIIRVNEATLRDNARRLVEKLEAYGVKGRVDEIHPGPVVTMYEFEPESGTKLSKIANLADDLAMALAAQKVRIVAPIPGKARVGFELPNDERQTVYLREILEDDRWMEQNAHLPMALGKDIAGHPVYGDLSKMPHLLVAGATGQGKSVGINVMLASLLTHKTPEEVRLLMIDPKVVELAVFDGIPHMLLPVVTDMKKAALALRWAVDEMERRYQLFADAGCRNIITYNARVEKVERGELSADKFIRRGKTPGTSESSELPPEVEPEKLPYVVAVVDEFADLMMVAAKDVEACVARLAQKARAAGIHVILATQRPSVDVITGMIKANFPCRMAFKVSQREDSKTILGRSGAEHLLGKGDMLLLPPGASDLTRVHGAYIDEDEVKTLCDFLREQAEPIYDEEILRPRDDEEGAQVGVASDDPLYDKAVAVVAQAGYCSISHIQRQLGVGYNKAAKLVERMETEGVVGPASGKAGGRRDVLIQAL